MLGAIFNLWTDITVPARVLLSLGLILLSAGAIYLGFTWTGCEKLWLLPGIVGLVLLLFSDAGHDSKGYHF